MDDLNEAPSSIVEVYTAFKSKGKSDFAYKTLVKGRKVLKNDFPLNIYFAEYYASIGQSENMINEYLDLLDKESSYQGVIQAMLSKQIKIFTLTANKELRG